MDDERPDTFDRALATEQIRRIILSYPELVDRGDLAGVGRLLAGVRFGAASGRNAPVIPREQLTTRTAEEVRQTYESAVIFYDDGLLTPSTSSATSTLRFPTIGRRPRPAATTPSSRPWTTSHSS